MPQLLKALEDPDGDVRKRAIVALGEIGVRLQAFPGVAEVVPCLIRALQSHDIGIRSEAVLALGKMGPAAVEAVPELIEVLRFDDEAMCPRVVFALGEIGPAAAQAVPCLINVLHDRDFQVSQTTVEALGKLGVAAAEAVPRLIHALKDNDDGVVTAAAEALGKMGSIATEAVPQLIKTLQHQYDWVCMSAAAALSQMGFAAAAEAVPQLLIALEDPHDEARERAAMALGNMGPAVAAGVPQLIRVLQQKNRFGEMSAAALSLKHLVSVLARADAREPVHGVILQLVLSLCQDTEDFVHPHVALAVQEAIFHSDSDDVLQSAVKALPSILKSSKLSTFQVRGLVQRALRMVPEAAVKCKLHELLEDRHADDGITAVEHAISLPGSRGFGFVTTSGSKACLTQPEPLAKPSSGCSSSSEVSLALYAMELTQKASPRGPAGSAMVKSSSVGSSDAEAFFWGQKNAAAASVKGLSTDSMSEASRGSSKFHRQIFFREVCSYQYWQGVCRKSEGKTIEAFRVLLPSKARKDPAVKRVSCLEGICSLLGNSFSLYFSMTQTNAFYYGSKGATGILCLVFAAEFKLQ